MRVGMQAPQLKIAIAAAGPHAASVVEGCLVGGMQGRNAGKDHAKRDERAGRHANGPVAVAACQADPQNTTKRIIPVPSIHRFDRRRKVSSGGCFVVFNPG